MRNQIVILAAGKGTRMGGNVPKVLVMLKNKPLILYLLEEIEKINQLVKPVIVTGYQAEKVRAVLGEHYIYALQKQQLGTAHALLAAKEKITGENILVLYGDMPFIKAESLKQLMRLHKEKKVVISMFTTTVPDFEGLYESFKHYGRVVREGDRIVKVVEYKDAGSKEQQITEINTGIYMFNTNWLWQHVPKLKNENAQGEYYLTDIVELAINHGERVEALPIEPKEVMGINSKQDLKQAEVQA